MDAMDARASWERGSEDGGWRLRLAGEWTVRGLRPSPRLDLPAGARRVELGAADATLDSAGACAVDDALRAWEAAGVAVDRGGLAPRQRALLELVRSRRAEVPAQAPRLHAGLLGDIGRAVLFAAGEGAVFLAALGELVWRGVPALRRLRWREVAAELEGAGLRALGIVGLLSFLIGMVMAYQGGATLATYGANILIVNLVSIITLREMAPLLTAILVAGRTGSSYAAQIGTMRITEEIDALRVLGTSPFELLVLPKAVALAVAMPLLSLYADAMGLLGGSLVAYLGYGLPLQVFFERVPQVTDVRTLMLGLTKAPVFAVVIALIGCSQGLRVRGSAAAVGRATTAAVVQAIFLVIVIDAGFSVLYNLLGL